MRLREPHGGAIYRGTPQGVTVRAVDWPRGEKSASGQNGEKGHRWGKRLVREAPTPGEELAWAIADSVDVKGGLRDRGETRVEEGTANGRGRALQGGDLEQGCSPRALGAVRARGDSGKK